MAGNSQPVLSQNRPSTSPPVLCTLLQYVAPPAPHGDSDSDAAMLHSGRRRERHSKHHKQPAAHTSAQQREKDWLGLAAGDLIHFLRQGPGIRQSRPRQLCSCNACNACEGLRGWCRYLPIGRSSPVANHGPNTPLTGYEQSSLPVLHASSINLLAQCVTCLPKGG